MIANYHTHTWRCKHATGTEREYIENAIEGGLKILGFSDHAPMPYPEGYVSRAKMDMDQLEGYVDTILGLKKEYREDIQIHLGLEAEYYPEFFDKLLEITGQYPIEYFLLGQHFLGNEVDDHFCWNPTESEKLLVRYCEQSQKALETGYFTYFAHPDFFHYTGDPDIYDVHMRRLCYCARQLEIPLEINFFGIWQNRYYPNPAFWKIAGEVGNYVIFGTDAHQPDKVWDPETICTAEKIVEKYGLTLVDTVTL